MKTFLMPIALAASLLFLSLADLRNSSLRVGFVKNAEAIIGMPRTPLSVAGVARRSVYTAAVTSSAAAASSATASSAAAASAASANAAAANAAAASAAAQRPPEPPCP